MNQIYITIIAIILVLYTLSIYGFWTYLKWKWYEANNIKIGSIIKIKHPDTREIMEVKVKSTVYLGRDLYIVKPIMGGEDFMITKHHIVFENDK
jgi:hypothetical protein